MKSLDDQQDILEESTGGRHKALTENMLLKAIGKYQTASPSELLEKLNKAGIEVSRVTLWRRMKDLPQELIEATLQQVTDNELKPEQHSYSAFCQLPLVKDYSDNLLYIREVSPKYHKALMRGLFWLCKKLNKKPQALQSKESIDLCADLIMRIKKGEVKRGLESAMNIMRSWYLYNGIAGKYMTSKGITGDRIKGRGKRSDVKLSQEHRHRFLEAVKSHFNDDWSENGNTIPFLSEPYLCQAMECCIKFEYYTGTRKMATLNADWRNVTWGEPITFVKVVDKGKHKLGRITWKKRLAGEFLQEFKAYWERLGCPETGRIFPFDPSALPAFYNHCYAEAQIPEKIWGRMPTHIWRHTACQDMLLATDWNEEQTAKLLGWESKDTMTRHYGKASPEVINRGLLRAMGMPVPPEEKHEFKF
jgi:integrase